MADPIEQLFAEFVDRFRTAEMKIIRDQIHNINLKLENTMIDVAKIQAAATRAEAGIDSVLAVLATLVAQVKDLSTQLAAAIAAADPAAQQAVQTELDKLATDLDAKSDAIAAATAAPPTP